MHYVVEPDGHITASNQIVRRQLVFGTKAADAPNRLPVKLAVALLADRHSVIILNLPVSGSLDNPTFSILGVFRHSLMTVLGKAVTAPFALLSRSLSGLSTADTADTALNSIRFDAGSAILDDVAKTRLSKIATIRKAKKSLNLSIVGAADAQVESEAIRQARLQGLLNAETGSDGRPHSAPQEQGGMRGDAETQGPNPVRRRLRRSAHQRSEHGSPGRTTWATSQTANASAADRRNRCRRRISQGSGRRARSCSPGFRGSQGPWQGSTVSRAYRPAQQSEWIGRLVTSRKARTGYAMSTDCLSMLPCISAYQPDFKVMCGR